MHNDNRSKGSRGALAALLSALMVLGLLTGCSAGPAEPAAEQTAPEEVFLIQTAPAAVQKFADTFQVSGEAGPAEQADISAKIGGDIYQLKADIGDAVKAGQVLARIDDTRYALAREQAGIGVSTAQLNLDQQRIDLERYQALYEQQAISQKEYEAALNGLKMTELSLKSAQAGLRSADINMKDTAVTAPISGFVSARKVNAGESVNPGTPLFSVVDISRIVIVSGISEDAVNQLKPGMPVQVTVASLGAEVFEGTVTQISPVQDSAKLYPVKVEVPNPEGRIKAGMFATASVALSEGVEGLAVPKEAVIHETGKDYVFIAAGDKALRKEVTVGLGDDRYYHIKAGIAAGDAVVVVGQEKLKDGVLVKIGQ